MYLMYVFSRGSTIAPIILPNLVHSSIDIDKQPPHKPKHFCHARKRAGGERFQMDRPKYKPQPRPC
ncbi:hypothetical protein K432DRAFT_386480 [Lepidopterella palustris CBS 459.81]|uniref:Uncharacterized protein n=1 Tax=Lepidopterella palustris CBS 459.81 TaxID=1314670 RepID=A0A8E2JA44_9PEZI|nr:hypothetical protein K432DRAFT_386480 [Lepidopterella palustris CBS 459.81]